MTDFPVDKRFSATPVDLGSINIAENPSGAAVADRVNAMAASFGTAPSEVIEAAEIGDPTPINTAKAQGSDVADKELRKALQAGQVDLDTLSRSISQATEKAEVKAALEDYYIEQGILTEGAQYSVADLKYTTNMIIAEQLFRDRISAVQQDTGALGYIGDFVDRYFIRHMPIGLVEDLTRRTERKGEELLQAAVTMNPKEYKQFISGYIEELADEGVFAEENIFALLDGFEEATNAGYDPLAGVNQILGVVEVGALAGTGIKSLKALNKADHTILSVTALEGQEAGAVAAENIIKATDNLDATAKTKAGAAVYDPGTAVVRPQAAKTIEIAENNRLWSRIRELQSSGAFGVADATAVRLAAETIAKNFAERISNPTNGFSVVEDLTGNHIARVDFGKVKDGTPYTRLTDAEKAVQRAEVPEAFAAPVDPEDLSKGYVVRMEQRIDTQGLADEFDTNAVEYDFVRSNFAKIFGSNAATDDEGLNALANMAEAGQTVVKRSADPLLEKLRKIPTDSKKAISRAYKELRDGIDAELKEGYTRSEFIDVFTEKHPKGLAPTKADMDAYDALVELEDTGWLLRSAKVLNNYVKKGYWALDMGNDSRVVARKANKVDGEIKVYNAESGAVETIDKLEEGMNLWQLDVPMKDSGLQYVANPRKVSILDHSDVMAFNAGGRRINPEANYFVAFEGDVPRAFLTTFSEKQARKAVEQFENIRQEIRKIGKDIENIRASDELDNLIRANNDWNPDITTFEEFSALVKRKGWDLSKKVSFKQRDGELENLSKDSPMAGEKWDNYVRTQLTRYNDVLMDYGGGEAHNLDPVSAILQEFGNAATHYTHRQYTYDAAAAWTKRAARKGSGVRLSDSYPKDDWLNQVQHAEIIEDTATARALRHQRSIIRRRLKMKGPVQQRFEAFGQEAAEFVFDKTGVKLKGSPVDKLLGLGFQSAFGFFNMSQLLMQSAHVMAITAISPKYAAKAGGMSLGLRMAMHAGDPAVEALAIKRLAKSSGMREDDIKELVTYYRTSGRDVVDGDAVELGTGPSYGISGWGENSYIPSQVRDVLKGAVSGGRKALDFGLLPFKTGERLSRQIAINTAFLEFKAKFPGKSALSREGRMWITNREQYLTFNMTSSDRALFQEGAMRLPTQWLSYTFRSFEAMVIGRGFTGKERARLAAVLVPMYGLTGFGAGSAADYFAEKFGVENVGSYMLMKYGVIDWLIQWATPVETTLATRLAPLTGFTDLYKKIFKGEASLPELIMGPSGDITGRALGTFFDAVGDLLNQRTVSLTEDTLALLRTPTGLDNLSKAYGIYNNGVYRSKTGTITPLSQELGTADALMVALGFTPAEVVEFYDKSAGQYTNSKKLRKFKREVQRDYQRALQIWREDEERGKTMMHEIHTKVSLSGFPLSQQQEIIKGMRDVDPRLETDLINNLIERDRKNSAMIFEKMMRGDD